MNKFKSNKGHTPDSISELIFCWNFEIWFLSNLVNTELIQYISLNVIWHPFPEISVRYLFFHFESSLFLKCDPSNLSFHIHCSDHIQCIDPKIYVLTMKLQSLMSMQTDPEQFWRMFSGDLSERHRSAARAVKLWIAMDCNGPGPSLLSQFVLMCIPPFLIPVWSIHTLTDRILMCPNGEQSPNKREIGGVGVLQSQCWKPKH